MGRLSFATSIWYEDVDLIALESRYGVDFLLRLYLHIIAFDLNRLVSFAPEEVDFGPLTPHVDTEFVTLWSEITHGIWSQWRYENRLPSYEVPAVVRPEATLRIDGTGPATLDHGGVLNLVFCGGGKDSLLAMKIMELAGQPFDTLGYSHSIYGRARPQHALIEDLVGFGAGGRHRRLSMFDDLMDSPVLEVEPHLDAVIFPCLNGFLEAVPATHSCNIDKPWCKRCPKCVYVWLNYQAYLPTEVPDGIFGENLFDVPENQPWFRQLLGLTDHTPFECVGQVEESRLAFELCRRKGLRGEAMDLYEREVIPKSTWADVGHLFEIGAAPDRIPAAMRAPVLGVLDQLAREGAAGVRTALASAG